VFSPAQNFARARFINTDYKKLGSTALSGPPNALSSYPGSWKKFNWFRSRNGRTHIHAYNMAMHTLSSAKNLFPTSQFTAFPLQIPISYGD
jgi:hypothetical protein